MAIQDDNTILNKGDLKAYHEAIAPLLGGTFMVSTNNSDYFSTDEKVVGVWTDGKPLYQKTVEQILNSGDSAEYHIPTGVSDLDTMVDMQGFYLHSNGSVSLLPAIYVISAGGNLGGAVQITFVKASNWIMVRPGTGGWFPSGDSYGVRITFRYTKTTDAAGSATTTPGAYDINFPNTWPTNTEIYFGNGVYGYRKTGVHNIVEDDRTDTLITTLPVDPSGKFVSFGGSVAWKSSPSDANTYENAFPFDSPTQAGKPVSAQLVKVVSGGVYLRTWGNTTASGLPYDIWFTFTR